jgi:hypothetical protein
MSSAQHRRPRRLAGPAILAGGIIGSVVLALSLTGTLSAFTASIANSVNTTTVGTLVMKEVSGANTCTSTDSTTNAATCATINKYGGQTLLPGGSSTTTVTITNQGTATPTSFTLTPGTCAQTGGVAGITPATDFCTQVSLKIYAAATATGSPIFTGTLASLTAQTLTALAPAAAQPYTFVVSTPGTLGNSYQGLSAAQTLTWAFSS